jgi:hypothetical protein
MSTIVEYGYHVTYELLVPQNTGFNQSDLKSVDEARKLAIAMSDPTKGKNQKKCDEALKKLTNGKIPCLNSLESARRS